MIIKIQIYKHVTTQSLLNPKTSRKIPTQEILETQPLTYLARGWEFKARCLEMFFGSFKKVSMSVYTGPFETGEWHEKAVTAEEGAIFNGKGEDKLETDEQFTKRVMGETFLR